MYSVSSTNFGVEKGSFRTWLLMFTSIAPSITARRRWQTGSLTPILSNQLATREVKLGVRPASPRQPNNILVEQVLKTLQPRQRRTIELVYYEGLTSEEISVRTLCALCAIISIAVLKSCKRHPAMTEKASFHRREGFGGGAS